jgi:hypothetical protein
MILLFASTIWKLITLSQAQPSEGLKKDIPPSREVRVSVSIQIGLCIQGRGGYEIVGIRTSSEETSYADDANATA